MSFAESVCHIRRRGKEHSELGFAFFIHTSFDMMGIHFSYLWKYLSQVISLHQDRILEFY